jgi:uncharacterized protein
LALLTRRSFLLTAGVGALALGADALVVEPNLPRLVRIEMPLPGLPEAFDGFTIAQLSDLHYDKYTGILPIKRAVEIANRAKPDLVVLTGDFVTVSDFVDYLHNRRESALTAEPCAALLSKLSAPFGSMAVLGNHDIESVPQIVVDALESTGVRVLINRCETIEQNGARLWICGLDSVARRPRIDIALRGVPQDETVILLMHEPDYADIAARFPVRLQLSGHSHGGQIWLPGIGAPWLPGGARKYPRGQYTVGGLKLYTNFGVGTIRMPVRFLAPAEVTLVTLRASKANK